jgi:hypothetical protein
LLLLLIWLLLLLWRLLLWLLIWLRRLLWLLWLLLLWLLLLRLLLLLWLLLLLLLLRLLLWLLLLLLRRLLRPTLALHPALACCPCGDRRCRHGRRVRRQRLRLTGQDPEPFHQVRPRHSPPGKQLPHLQPRILRVHLRVYI